MEKLEDAWQKTVSLYESHGILDSLPIRRAIRSFLQNLKPSFPDSILVANWCRRALSCDLLLEEIHGLAFQLFFTVCPEDASSFDYNKEIRTLYIADIRARLVTQNYKSVDIVSAFCDMASLGRQGNLTVSMTVNLLEVIQRIVPLCPADIKMEEYVEFVSLFASHRDDLVLHNVRSLIITIYKTFPPSSTLDNCVSQIGPESKLRFALMMDLLESDIVVAGLTDLKSVAGLIEIISRDKAIAPVVADCAVMFAKVKNIPLNVCRSDPEGFIGTFLFPRIVKRLPTEVVFSYLNQLESPSFLSNYFSLLMAIYNGELKKPSTFSVNLSLVSVGLENVSEIVRNRAFTSLCRSVDISHQWNHQIGNLVYQFFFDSLLSATSDTRQQIEAAMKTLLETCIARCYRLQKSVSDERISSEQRDEALEEIKEISSFWKEIIECSLKCLSNNGHYNKNDLSLRLVNCLVKTKHEKYNSLNIKDGSSLFVDSFDKIDSLIDNEFILEKLYSCLFNNTFDMVRQRAADLLLHFRQSQFNPLNEKDGIQIFEQKISPLLESHRAHQLDGVSKLLSVYCQINQNHSRIRKILIEKLSEASLLLNMANPESFIQSPVLGLMTVIQTVIPTGSHLELKEIIESSIKIASAINVYIFESSPEGHQIQFNEAEDEDDMDDRSFSIMTFCWRTIKEFGFLIASCWKQYDRGLDLNFLKSTAEFLLDNLLGARHPGAFISLARALSEICKSCFFSLNANFLALPKQLLLKTLECCREKPHVQTTRRSAGVPYCISSIISATNDDSLKQSLLDLTINFLLSNVSDHKEAFENINPKPSVVHTLNVLLMLYKESTLAEKVTKHLPAGFALCFQAFTSPNWSVRNSGLMMFTALMNRTFGVRHDVNVFASSNLLDIRNLHFKCSQILALIHKELESSINILQNKEFTFGNERYRIEFAVYPLLSFIQRIRFSVEGHRQHSMFYFICMEFVWKCLENDIMKVRMMSARLLRHMASDCIELRNSIREKIKLTSIRKANMAHGIAALLKELLEHSLVDLEEYNEASGIILENYSNCYLIWSLLVNDTVEGAKEDSQTRVDIKEAVESIKERNISEEKISTFTSALINHIKTDCNSNLATESLELFIRFWTNYDLTGTYRKSLIKNWDPNVPLNDAVKQIYYLALTDDDEDVREGMAAIDNSFGPRSVPAALRIFLNNHSSVVQSLIDYIPITDPSTLDTSRGALFECEPLNSFKDPEWEKMFLSMCK